MNRFIYNRSILLLLLSISLLVSCGKDDNTYDVELYLKYPESNHIVENDRIFYIYDYETGILFDSVAHTGRRAPVLSLPEGTYTIIGVENAKGHCIGMHSLESAKLLASPDGTSNYYFSKATFEVTQDASNYLYTCKFDPLCGSLSIFHDFKSDLVMDKGSYFTITIERNDGGSFQMENSQLNKEKSTVVSPPVLFTGEIGNMSVREQKVYLFPLEENTTVILGLTFYKPNGEIMYEARAEQIIPISRGIQTIGRLNLSKIEDFPFQISISQVPFDCTDIYVEPSDYIAITDINLNNKLKENFPYAFNKEGNFDRLNKQLRQETTLNLFPDWSGSEYRINDISQIYGVFPNLTVLHVENNNLENLDLSYFPKLKELNCNENLLQALDITPCLDLQILFCNTNTICNLDLTSCTKLQYLDCSANQLSELKTEICPDLQVLNCAGNQLKLLSIEKNHQLLNLDCSDNKLQILPLPVPNQLTSLKCHSNQLSAMDLEHAQNLTYFNCNANLITTLDVSECISIVDIYIDSNRLQSLILGNKGLSKLMTISCIGITNILTDIENLSKENTPNIYVIQVPPSAKDGPALHAFHTETSFWNIYWVDENNIAHRFD